MLQELTKTTLKVKRAQGKVAALFHHKFYWFSLAKKFFELFFANDSQIFLKLFRQMKTDTS